MHSTSSSRQPLSLSLEASGAFPPMKILLSPSKLLHMAAPAAFYLMTGCCSLLAQDTPEAMLAEYTPIRSQKGIKVVGHLRNDNRSGFDCMWHLQHSAKRFAALARQAGFHRCKKNEFAWRRCDAIKAFHLEPASLTHYLQFCSSEPGDLVWCHRIGASRTTLRWSSDRLHPCT